MTSSPSPLFLHRLGRAVAALALLAIWATAVPQPVAARTVRLLSPDCDASVTPSEVTNTAAVTLVITSPNCNFTGGEIVVVEGYGGLETTWINDKVLHAILPKDVPAREYRVQVVFDDGTNLGSSPPSITVHGPDATSKPTETRTVTPSPVPTNTPGPTAYISPAINVLSYGASSAIITPGQDFDFEITLINRGQIAAVNASAEFVAGDISPRATGGVQTIASLGPGETWRFSQPLRASDTLWGADTGTVTVNVTYFDVNGQDYSDSFTLTFQLSLLADTATPTLTPTPTQTPMFNPRLLITGYDTGGQSIGPGDQFDLQMQIQNVGNAAAKGVTMIFNGGQESDGSGTASASGDFSDFAPQDGSNLRFVGDLAAGQTLTVVQTLVVNGSSVSGAYPLQFSFVYSDDHGVSHTDEQVITALIVAAPRLEISFYEEPETFVVGESNLLPLQIVNNGLNSVVLGSMRVEGGDARYSNNAILVGTLDQGSYFTLDAVVVPAEAGTLEFAVTIDYTDAFNRTQVITQTMQVEVAGPTPEPGTELEGEQQTAASGGFLQTLWRAILGFFGIGG